jgi:hypothetical protein
MGTFGGFGRRNEGGHMNTLRASFVKGSMKRAYVCSRLPLPSLSSLSLLHYIKKPKGMNFKGAKKAPENMGHPFPMFLS